MRVIRRVLSPILNVLLEPIVCRVADRLRPGTDSLESRLVSVDSMLGSLCVRIEEVERTLAPPFLPTVVKNEAQNISELPLPLLKTMKNSATVGYFAQDVAARLPDCRALPEEFWRGGGCSGADYLPHNLIFLDEFYFFSTMRNLFSPLHSLKGAIVVAMRFEYLPELRYRTLLHQLGFMEVALLKYDALTDELLTFSVTHAGFFTGDPTRVDVGAQPPNALYPSVWLLARRTAEFTTPDGATNGRHV
jgi:hypothetical protein